MRALSHQQQVWAEAGQRFADAMTTATSPQEFERLVARELPTISRVPQRIHRGALLIENRPLRRITVGIAQSYVDQGIELRHVYEAIVSGDRKAISRAQDAYGRTAQKTLRLQAKAADRFQAWGIPIPDGS